MKYKHIVFDVDGTLVDNATAVLKTWQDTIKQVTGRTYTAEELGFVMGISSNKAIEQLGLTPNRHLFKLWEANYKKHYNEVKLFKDITSVLNHLKKEGYTLGIVTSRTHYELSEDEVMKAILPFFDTKICVEDASQPKPSPAPLLAYIAQSNAVANEILYIGDTLNDATCAKAANIHFVWAAWGLSIKENNLFADDVCKQPIEITQLVR